MKKILLFIALIGVFASCTKEPGTVTGVVTYFYNDYQGFKPDVGAKVYFTESNCDSLDLALDAISAEQSVISCESLIYSLKSLIDTYEKSANAWYNSKSEKEEAKQKADKSRSELLDREKSLADETQRWLKIIKDSANAEVISTNGYRSLLNITTNDSTLEAAVDGAGNYTISLPPAKYTMIVVSKGRTRFNLLEGNGRIITRTIEVKSKETINENFEVKL